MSFAHPTLGTSSVRADRKNQIMPRIIGVDIPQNKRIDIALRYVYGIGPKTATEIVEKTGIKPATRAKDLDETELSKIVHVIQGGDYLVEGDLRRERSLNLKRLQNIKSTEVCGMRAAFRFGASAPQLTPALAKAKRKPLALNAIQMPRPAFIDFIVDHYG